MVSTYTIEKGKEIHLREIQKIYNDAVLYTTATLDWKTRDYKDMIAWYKKFESDYPLLVAEISGHVVGYCTLSPFREKHGYIFTEELSIYVHSNHRKQGIASMLLYEMIAIAKKRKTHSIVACISEGNDASILLHEKFEFTRVGLFQKIGYKFDQFHDAYFYQKIL